MYPPMPAETPAVADEVLAQAGAADVSEAARTFASGECLFRVAGASARQLEEIEEFLVPAGNARADSYNIDVVADAALLAHVWNGCASNPRRIELQAFADENRMAADGAAPWSLYCSLDGPRLAIVQNGTSYVLLTEGEREAYASSPMRLIRELYVRTSQEKALMMHSAAFVRDGEGWLIVGGKCAGKTTLLFTFLDGREVSYLGNDRLVVSSELELFPFPRPCRIGLGTMRAIPMLAPLLHDLGSLRREQDPELAQGNGESFGSEVKVELSPADIVRRLRVPHAASAPLRQLLIPELLPGSAELTVEALTAGELRQQLEAEALVPSTADWEKPWLIERGMNAAARERRTARMLDAIAGSVSGYRLRFGTEVPPHVVRAAAFEAAGATR
jgi:hypothetical protein